MKVEIWSDIACPWCHIGKRRFEAALERFQHCDRVEVCWRSFELDPGAGRTTGVTDSRGPADENSDYVDRLAVKYGTTRAGAQQMLDTMTQAAAAEGLDFRFDRARRANTFDAHQVIHLGGERGVQDAVKERLLLAYFTEGQAVDDHDVLVRLGAEAGLDPAEVRHALDDQRYASAVRADEAEAASLGIRGVPFFVVDRRYGVSGAQPADQLLEVLQRAWSESQPLTLVGAGEGDPACGPDGCSI